jgi:hypothetical protein
MRILCSVVQTLVRPVLNSWHYLSSGSPIGGQLVGDDALGHDALPLHQPGQQALSCLGVAAALDDLVEDISVLINGSPEPVLLASNADDHLIQMPDVMRARPLAAEATGVLRTELLAPPADRLVRYDDAALEQHLLREP